MLSPKNSTRGKLLSQYVCVRVTRMDNVDIGLFDRDWNNTIYYFMLNADEQIYMRYGGRDSQAADAYLNLNSLELALEKGLEQYRIDVGHFPSSEQGLAALTTRPGSESRWNGPYLKKDAPSDPWGHPYVYKMPGEHGEFDLVSYGRDGQPGGDEEAADIANW